MATPNHDGTAVNSLINDKSQNQYSGYDNLEDLIMDYAHKHDVWGRDQYFYEKLIKIAENFRDPYA